MLRFSKPVTDKQKAYFASYGYLLPWLLLGAALFTLVDSGLSGTNLSLYFHSKVSLVMPTDGVAWVLSYCLGYVLSFVLGFAMGALTLVGFINIQKNFDDDASNDTEPVLNWLTIGLAVGLGGFMVWNSVQSSVYISETQGYQGTEFSTTNIDAANMMAIQAANDQYTKDLAALERVYSQKEQANSAATANAVQGWKNKASGASQKWAMAQAQKAENRGLAAFGAFASEKEKKIQKLQETREKAVNTAENRYKQGIAKVDKKQKADNDKVAKTKNSIKTSLIYISCFTVPSIFFFYFVIARILVFSGMRIIFEVPKNLSDGSGWGKIWAAVSYYIGVLLGNTAHKIRASAPPDLGALPTSGAVNTGAVNTPTNPPNYEAMFLQIQNQLAQSEAQRKQDLAVLQSQIKPNSGVAPTPPPVVNMAGVNTVNTAKNDVNTAEIGENVQNAVNTALNMGNRAGADEVDFSGIDFGVNYKETDFDVLDVNTYTPELKDLKNRFSAANNIFLNPNYSRAAPDYDGSRGDATENNKKAYLQAVNEKQDTLQRLYAMGLTIRKIQGAFRIVKL